MTSRWLPGLILLLATAGATAAEPVDLAKLDRSIAKEPKYATNPEYCLLVFGPKAETRVWLVRDGSTLYADRNGNGDLTEPGEAYTTTYRENPWWSSVGDIAARDDMAARDGKAKYRILEIQSLSKGYRIEVKVGPEKFQCVGAQQAEKPKFADKAKDAPIIHFDGPLALAQYSTKSVIPRNNEGRQRKRSLRVMVGTAGLGVGTFAAYECCLCDKLGPLVAKFEFSPLPPPSAQASSARTGPPIETTQSFTYDD